MASMADLRADPPVRLPCWYRAQKESVLKASSQEHYLRFQKRCCFDQEMAARRCRQSLSCRQEVFCCSCGSLSSMRQVAVVMEAEVDRRGSVVVG